MNHQQAFHLKHQVLINWGQTRAGNYDMGKATLLTGETGSGKSTMLDSLQAVMTGGHKQVMNFNPAQDEVGVGPARGKTKRTIESYVCGAEYSKFSRPDGAHAYIAAVFVPTGEGPLGRPFTALMAVSAHVEGDKESARQAVAETSLLFILDGVQLNYDDLMQDPVAGECVPVESIARHLKQKFPHVVEFGTRKSDYLCALYGRFRGKPGPVPKEEAFSAARAWVQSIAYRPIGSVNDLVRNEILDFDSVALEESVGRIASLMRQVSDLRKELAYLNSSESCLSGLSTLLGGVRATHVDAVETDYLSLKATGYAEATRAQHLNNVIEQAKQTGEELAGRQDVLNSQKAELDSQRTMVQARLLGIPGQQQKQNYEDKVQAAETALAKTLRELTQALRIALLLETKAKAVMAEASRVPRSNDALEGAFGRIRSTMEKALKMDTGTFLKEVDAALAGALEPEVVRALVTRAKAWSLAVYEELYEAMVGHDDKSLLFIVNQQAALHSQRMSEAERVVTDLASRNTKHAQGRVSYPGGVGMALEQIREEFPAAHAQILCDLVDPVSTSWQPAIEAYMGKARFSILVLPDWERQVIDYVRAHRLDARVVQGSLCLARRKKMVEGLPPESIVRELSTSNEIAEAYLYDQYGLVVKVDDTNVLRQTPRGLMKDGKASGSRTMFVSNIRGDLFFGTAARKALAEAASQSLADAERERKSLQETEGAYAALRLHFASIKAPQFTIPEVDAYLTDIVSARGALAALDTSAAEGLTVEVARLTKQIRALDKEGEQARDEIVRLNLEAENAQRQLKNQAERGKVLTAATATAEARVRALEKVIPGYAADLRISLLDKDSIGQESNVEALNAKVASQSRVVLEEMGKVRDALSAFNVNARMDDRLQDALPYHINDAGFDKGIVDAARLEKAVNDRLQALRSIGLLNTNTQLETAVSSFNDVFTKQFCLEIRTRVEDGVRTLRNINNVLKNLVFGYDRYSLDWSRWVPEMREYLDFFDAVMTMTAANEELDLFGATSLAPAQVVVRDKLVELLLDEDQERAQKELMRIADYRNYRTYDILNDSKHGGLMRLSEWGTGSGGQLETPCYIVRAAVLMNRLRCFEKGPSLRLMMSDESFAKMDEPRSRSVMHFMRDALGFQMICAMPTTKTTAILDEFSVRYGFMRLEGIQNGELDFMTEVNCTALQRVELSRVWDEHRELATNEARDLFEQENPA